MKIKLVLITVFFFVIVLLINPKAQPSKVTEGNNQLPIIDMHAHIHCLEELIPWGAEFQGLKGCANKEEYFEKAYHLFRKNNVKAVVSSSLELVEKWRSQDEDNRIIPALLMLTPTQWDMTSDRFETLAKSGKIKVFGELAPLYAGGTLNDTGWKPYLKVCERYDIPVVVHTGAGFPGEKNTWREKTRQRLGDPYLIEDILVEYPKLRISMAHSGQEYHEHALILMDLYPQVYSDLAALLNFGPQMQRLCREFLIKAKNDGILDRVMFGSDMFMLPQHLEIALDHLDSLEFLTEKDKRDILYNNAARFLKLNE
ncbi:amidohydrolase family protein [Planctomycetota bacterium]